MYDVLPVKQKENDTMQMILDTAISIALPAAIIGFGILTTGWQVNHEHAMRRSNTRY